MKQQIGKWIGSILVLVVWFFIQQNSLTYIFDWSTAELVGYNAWTLLTLGIAIYIIYRIFRKKQNG